MSNDQTLSELAATVGALQGELAGLRVLQDKMAIFECVNRYTRGIDRHDSEMIASVFHRDAVDNHGDFLGSVDEYIEWVNSGHSQTAEAHMHNVTSHTSEIDGNTAHAETYVIVVLRGPDGDPVRISGGRYLDRLEKRDGEWKIQVRRVVMDWRGRLDGGPWIRNRRGYPMGTWDKDDMSYMRPLDIDDQQRQQLKARTSA